MIDVSKLDKLKQYYVLEVGNGLIACAIQNFCKSMTTLPTDKIASHLLILRFVNGQWMVSEYHQKWNGGKTYPLSEYTTECEHLIFEHQMNNYLIDYYCSEYGNCGYSIQDIEVLAVQDLTGFKLPDNTNKMICSQFGAMVDDDMSICNHFKLPAYQITPLHHQIYFTEKEKTPCQNQV